MQENTDQNNSEYGHFLRIANDEKKQLSKIFGLHNVLS